MPESLPAWQMQGFVYGQELASKDQARGYTQLIYKQAEEHKRIPKRLTEFYVEMMKQFKDVDAMDIQLAKNGFVTEKLKKWLEIGT